MNINKAPDLTVGAGWMVPLLKIGDTIPTLTDQINKPRALGARGNFNSSFPFREKRSEESPDDPDQSTCIQGGGWHTSVKGRTVGIFGFVCHVLKARQCLSQLLNTALVARNEP